MKSKKGFSSYPSVKSYFKKAKKKRNEISDLNFDLNCAYFRRFGMVHGSGLQSRIDGRLKIHEMLNSLNLHILPFLENMNNGINESYVSSVEFNESGTLLCCASQSGTLRIIDVDSMLRKWYTEVRIKLKEMCKKKIEKEEEYKKDKNGKIDLKKIAHLKMSKHRIPFPIKSRLKIEVSNEINKIECCKLKNNKLYISGSNINIFDLNKEKKRLLLLLLLKNPSKNRYMEMNTTIDNSLLFASDQFGAIHGWDLRIKQLNNIPQIYWGHDSNNYQNGILSLTRSISNKSRNLCIKNMNISNDNNLLYIIRMNGQIQIFDIRSNLKPILTCSIWKSFKYKSKYKSNFGVFIDDAIFNTQTQSAIIRLQNSTILNIRLQIINDQFYNTKMSNNIIKTYQCDFSTKNNHYCDVSFLSKLSKRNIIKMDHILNIYGIPITDIICTGSLSQDLAIIDMSSDFNIFKSKPKSDLIGHLTLDDILVTCAVRPQCDIIACGLINNTVQIINIGDIIDEEEIFF